MMVVVACTMGCWRPAGASEEQNEDAYLAGYATAVIEREFQVGCRSVSVRNGVITLELPGLPSDVEERLRKTLLEVQGVEQVEIVEVQTVEPAPAPGASERVCAMKETSFFPKGGSLFEPLIADPRWPHFSASFVWLLDGEEFSHMGAVSFGERFPLYREVFPSGRSWELGIEAAVFSVFDMDADSYDLINSDFWVSFPSLTYRDRDFSALMRFYHQSSHLGDEYILRGGVDRVNLSYEALSLTLSQRLLTSFRIYGGGGYLVRRTPSELEPWFSHVGFEYESPRQYLKDWVTPLMGVDLQFNQENDWSTDLSLRVGVRFKSLETGTRRYLLTLDYYNGHAPSGQFYDRKIESLGVGTHFYF